MKKVHIVISSISYEGGTIQGVFTSRARAEECLRCLSIPDDGDWHHIVHVPLNDPDIFIRVETEDETILED